MRDDDSDRRPEDFLSSIALDDIVSEHKQAEHREQPSPRKNYDRFIEIFLEILKHSINTGRMRKGCLRAEEARKYMIEMGLLKLSEILDEVKVCPINVEGEIGGIRVSADRINYGVSVLPQPFSAMELRIPVDIVLRSDHHNRLATIGLEILSPGSHGYFHSEEVYLRNIKSINYIDDMFYRRLAELSVNLKRQLYSISNIIGVKSAKEYKLAIDHRVNVDSDDENGLLSIKAVLKPFTDTLYVRITVPFRHRRRSLGTEHVDMRDLIPIQAIVNGALAECRASKMIGRWVYKDLEVSATLGTEEALEDFARSRELFNRLRDTYNDLLYDIHVADNMEPISGEGSATSRAVIRLFDCNINIIEYFLFGKKYFNPSNPSTLMKTLVKSVEYMYHSGFMHGGALIYVIPRTIRLLEYLYSKLIVGRALIYGSRVHYILRAPVIYDESAMLRIIAENAEVDKENLSIRFYGVEVPVTDRFIDHILYLRENILSRITI